VRPGLRLKPLDPCLTIRLGSHLLLFLTLCTISLVLASFVFKHHPRDGVTLLAPRLHQPVADFDHLLD
jgi:hypothetical protein